MCCVISPLRQQIQPLWDVVELGALYLTKLAVVQNAGLFYKKKKEKGNMSNIIKNLHQRPEKKPTNYALTLFVYVPLHRHLY